MRLSKLSMFLIFTFVFLGGQNILVKAQSESGKNESQKKQQQSSAKSKSKKEKEITEKLPLMEVKRLEKEKPEYSIELRQVPLQDFFRLVAHDYDLNVIVDEKVEGKITASFTNVSLQEALDIIAQQKGLVLNKKGKIITIKPNFITKNIPLKNINISSVLGKEEVKASKGQSATSGSKATKTQKEENLSLFMRGSKGDIYDLLSSYGKIIPNKSNNSLIIIDYPEHVKKVEKLVKMMDQRIATKVIKIDHISVKQLFPELLEREREERKSQREERKEEREEIEGIKKSE